MTPGAIQHEKTREEARQRPELTLFEDKAEDPEVERKSAAEIRALANAAIRGRIAG